MKEYLMSTEMIMALSAIIGAFVGAISALVITWITKIYEDKKHRREVIIHTALENWKTQTELVRSVAQDSRGKVTLYPLDDFIIHHCIMAEILLGNKITPDKLEKTLRKSKELRKSLRLFSERERKESGDVIPPPEVD